MKRTVMAIAAVATLTGLTAAAFGQSDPIAERKQLMKMNGAALQVVVPMIRGTTPFDAAAAKKAMDTVVDDLTKFVTLFPAGSDKGDTKAGPAIWTDADGFKALAAKMVTDAKAAGTAADGGLDSFKTAFGAVAGNCQACHEKYRLK